MSYYGPPDTQDSDSESDDLPSFLSNLEERRCRAEKLDRIRIYLDLAVKREAELGELLDWLTFTKESFDKFGQDRQSNDMPSSEWIGAMESYLSKLIFDMNCGISRLSVLWESMCHFNIKKSKKEETALLKGNVWHWWRESKADPKTVSRIQELKPPSVEAILDDDSLATKCASELCFIMADIQKSLSINKALDMAFMFVQLGLQNINEAFQKRSKEIRHGKDGSGRKDSSIKLAQISAQLFSEKEKVISLEDKVSDLREQKQALLFHMQKIQEYPHIKDGLPPETLEVYQNIVNLTKAEQAETPQTSAIYVPKPISKFGQKSPKKRNLTDTTKSSAPAEEKTVSFSQEIEKKSTHLLEEFRENVLKILESSMEFNDNDQLNIQAKPQQVVKLYQFLQDSMHDCFNDIMTHIRGKCKDEIIEMPFQEMPLLESELWDSPETHPTEMLKEMSEEIKKHNKSIQNAGASLKTLIKLQDKEGKGFEQQRRKSLTQLLDMFKSINNIEKQQACKIRMALDSLWEMHKRMQERADPDKIQPLLSVSAILKFESEMKDITDSKPPVGIQEVMKEHVAVKEHSMVETPEAINEPGQEKLKHLNFSLDPQPHELSPVRDARKSVSPGDHMDRYIAEMTKRAKGLSRNVYVINVASQRVNIKLLEQALLRRTISPRIHRLVKDIIMQTLTSVENRLCGIMQRFLRHARLRQVCKILNARLLEARILNDGRSIRKCYIYLQKLDKLQTKVFDSGCTKQASIDLIRETSIERMLYLFRQMKVDYGINLAAPYYCSAQECLPYPVLTIVPKKLEWSLSPSHSQRRNYPNSQTPVQPSRLSPLPPSLLPNEHHRTARESERTVGPDEDSLERLWQIRHTNHSIHLASKQCAVPPLPFPIIPRLLEMDINEGRRKARRTLQDRMNGVLGHIFTSSGDT